MTNYSAFNVALQGEQMRNAQKMYFQLVAKARKTKLPEDFTAAQEVLKTSKHLEKVFDDTVKEVITNGPTISEL